MVELDRFKNVESTSVTEYLGDYDGVFAITRVHRFTYKADYEEEIELWRELFPESEGWTVESQTSHMTIFGKDYRDGKVEGHAMILEPGTYRRDENARAKTVKVEDYDYVRVAMNENQWPDQSEPYSRIVAFTTSRRSYIQIQVPRSAFFESWEEVQEAGKQTFTFKFLEQADSTDDAYSMLELWFKRGEQNYVVIVQLRKSIPAVPGLERTDRDEALLLDHESVIGRLPVEFRGKSVTVRMPDADGWEPCVAISRWAPVSVRSPYVRPKLIYVRVSSIEMAPEKQPFVRPNLWQFYKPVREAE